jgi:hypothetical protein
MKRSWIGAMVFACLGLIGCGSSTVQHFWIASDVAVPAAFGPNCAPFGPFFNPAGGSIFFDFTNTYFDDLDIAVTSASDTCDATYNGFGLVRTNSNNGTFGNSTGSMPAGYYNLAINCFNTDGCEPLVHDFGYEH